MAKHFGGDDFHKLVTEAQDQQQYYASNRILTIILTNSR